MPRCGQSTRKPHVPSTASACRSCRQAGSIRAISPGQCAPGFPESPLPRAPKAAGSNLPGFPCVLFRAFADRHSPLPFPNGGRVLSSWGITPFRRLGGRVSPPFGHSRLRVRTSDERTITPRGGHAADEPARPAQRRRAPGAHTVGSGALRTSVAFLGRSGVAGQVRHGRPASVGRPPACRQGSHGTLRDVPPCGKRPGLARPVKRRLCGIRITRGNGLLKSLPLIA
jgi:hypothetical protein